jgi:putative ABC transport system permease protein
LKRSKEIGIRKVTGSSRNQLIIQFLGESLFITTLAFLPALALVELLLPVFSQLTNKHLESSYLLNPSTLLLFGLLLVIVAFLAGFYPALVLSGLNTAKSLKGQLKLTGRNLVGKSLVVAQFVIAAVLMVSMVVLHKQFGYISNADLGYKTDNILRFWLPWSADQPDPTLVKNQLARLPYIKQISSKSGDWNSTAFTVNGKKTDDVYYEDIDENHLQLMNIPLVKGRYLTYKIASDSLNNFVVNEAFVKAYVPKGVDPLSQTIGYGDKDIKNIVGVVKDFHYGSFKEKISPIVWRLPRNSRQISCIHVEIDGQHKQEALANILKVYRSFVPFQSFDYQFLDDFRMEQYAEDQRWKSILTYTSLIAFLISCLGLFGLASLNIEQRTKEIGIRKILGASVANISTMLSKEFLKLVFLGFVIALPISIYLADWWLKDFAYKINLSWDIFGFVAALMLAVAGITIAYQTIRAANANPAKNLRTE